MQHYLHLSTRKPLLHAAMHNLLAAHIDTMVEKGFATLMHEGRLEDLTRMYSLYALVDALPRLRQAFSAYIKRVGTAMVWGRDCVGTRLSGDATWWGCDLAGDATWWGCD